MGWLMGMGGGGSKAPNPLIARSGKWLATFVGLYAAIFWTVDVWGFFEADIIHAIRARYEGGLANFIYWLLKIAAYPLMFFAVRTALGVAFVSLAMWVMLKAFGGKR